MSEQINGRQIGLIGFVGAFAVGLVTVLANLKPAMDLLKSVGAVPGFFIMILSLVAIILVLYWPVLQQKRAKQERKNGEIDHLLACLARFGEEGATKDEKQFLLHHKEFLKLKPVTSLNYQEVFERYEQKETNSRFLVDETIRELNRINKV